MSTSTSYTGGLTTEVQLNIGKRDLAGLCCRDGSHAEWMGNVSVTSTPGGWVTLMATNGYALAALTLKCALDYKLKMPQLSIPAKVMKELQEGGGTFTLYGNSGLGVPRAKRDSDGEMFTIYRQADVGMPSDYRDLIPAGEGIGPCDPVGFDPEHMSTLIKALDPGEGLTGSQIPIHIERLLTPLSPMLMRADSYGLEAIGLLTMRMA